MLPSGKQLKVASVAILLLAAFFYAPVVPYGLSIDISGAGGCPPSQAGCQTGQAYTPAGVTGYATPAFSLLGYGPAPFPSQALVTQGNHSALLFFEGAKLEAAEYAGAANVVFNPSGTVYIQEAIVASSDYGLLNISITVKSYAQRPIQRAIVYLSMEGFSRNYTRGGLTWMEPRAVGTCGPSWAPGAECRVSEVTDNALPVNRSFYYSVEVRGYTGDSYFVFRRGYTAGYPAGGVGPRWVSLFISQVNKARGGVSLTENSTLDKFAKIRFMNASAHYRISDYGFSEDSARFLGINGTSMGDQEVLLYPLTYTPEAYANFLSAYAPGHWLALTDLYYAKFGYFIGEGPYYRVGVPCSVYEIPHAGLNISQFFGGLGCTTSVVPSTWLVIVLVP